MPQIICKGLKVDEVAKLSVEISENLGELMDTPSDWFVFEYVERKSFVNGKISENEVLVEIWWFDRGQEIKNQTAIILDKYIRSMGYDQIEINFNKCEYNSYFENGKHY